MMIVSNYDEMKTFSKNLNYIKDNQNYLEFNPIVDGQDKIKQLKPLELKSLDLESKVMQMDENVDNLAKAYNETVDVINEKFSFYNRLISRLEK
jgi:hypothetical protein